MTARFSLGTKEVPQHFEAVRLRPWVPLVGWPLSLVLVAAGVVLAAVTAAVAGEASGMVLAAVGGVGIVGLVRCRRFEIVVTGKTLEAAAGPYRRRVPLGFVGGATAGPATSWRRLYADREVTARLHAGGRPFVVPSAEPEELIAFLPSRQPG